METVIDSNGQQHYLKTLSKSLCQGKELPVSSVHIGPCSLDNDNRFVLLSSYQNIPTLNMNAWLFQLDDINLYSRASVLSDWKFESKFFKFSTITAADWKHLECFYDRDTNGRLEWILYYSKFAFKYRLCDRTSGVQIWLVVMQQMVLKPTPRITFVFIPFPETIMNCRRSMLGCLRMELVPAALKPVNRMAMK